MILEKLNKLIIKYSDVILLVIIISIVFLYKNDFKIENFTDGAEEILNSVSLVETTLNDIFNKVESKKVTIGKELTVQSNANIEQDLIVGKSLVVGTDLVVDSIKSKDKLCIGDVCITKDDLLKMKSQREMCGYAIDGDGSTHMLWSGTHSLKTGTASGWSIKKWDNIYLFKGWEMSVYKSTNATGTAYSTKNTTKKVLKWSLKNIKNKDMKNKVSSYKCTWVGY